MTLEEMKRLKDIRGYSFLQLSEYSGVPLGTIQKIFNGTTKNPRKVTLDALERVLTGDESIYTGKAYTYGGKGITGEGPMLRESSSAYGSHSDPSGKKTAFGEGPRHKKQGEYTLEDYYAIPDDRRVELIDGVIYDMTAPRPVHQAIIGLFYINIANYIRGKKRKCRVYLSPVDVQLDCDDRTMVEPDLIIICDQGKLRRFGLYGAPDFVLEVLSRSTRKKDMCLKLAKYENAGVREYWMIDVEHKRAIIYNFMEEEMIPLVIPLEGKQGIAIYDYELEIDLDEIAREIDEVP